MGDGNAGYWVAPRLLLLEPQGPKSLSNSESWEQTDSQLLSAYLCGDASALAGLCERYQQPLRRVVAAYLDPLVARRVSQSDLIQETWVVAVKKLKQHPQPPQIAVFPWLREIARERVIDVHRKHRGASKRDVYREQNLYLTDASVSNLLEILPQKQPSPSQAAIQNEYVDQVRRSLDALKPTFSEIIVLRFIECHDLRRCSAILGLTIEAAKSRQRRALAAFAEIMEHGLE